MSLTNTTVIERRYERPNIKINRRIKGIGIKIKVQGGTKLKTGINPKKTATSTNDKIPMAAVATTGKKSLFIVIDVSSPAFPSKLDNPPEVPLAKIW